MELTLLKREDMARTLERLASEVVERHGADAERLLLVGIQRRGVDLARRLVVLLERKTGKNIPLGTLDINLYRDDWTDGRPDSVELLVLVDRGHRELPIHADYVGRAVRTSRTEKVDVLLAERDGSDEVRLVSPR